MSIQSSGAVKNRKGWSQGGTLVAGQNLIVPMQVDFANDQDAVHTVLFGISPATQVAQPQQQPQPTPTPPNPIVTDANGNTSPAFVTNGSVTVLFPPPSANPVVPGSPFPLPAAGQLIQFDSDPTRIYTVAGNTPPSTVTLAGTGYKGTTQRNATASILGSATIPLTPPPAATTPQAIETIAIVQWTVAGIKTQRIVSIANGTSISGPGEAVQVQVIDNSSAPGSEGYAYNVSIAVTPGVRAAITPPVLYWNYPPGAELSLVGGGSPPTPQPFNAAVIAPNTAVSFPLPTNAGITTINLSIRDTTTPAALPVMVIIQQDPAGTILREDYTNGLGVYYPIVPGTTTIELQNPSTTDSMIVSVVFGIDG